MMVMMPPIRAICLIFVYASLTAVSFLPLLLPISPILLRVSMRHITDVRFAIAFIRYAAAADAAMLRRLI